MWEHRRQGEVLLRKNGDAIDIWLRSEDGSPNWYGVSADALGRFMDGDAVEEILRVESGRVSRDD